MLDQTFLETLHSIDARTRTLALDAHNANLPDLHFLFDMVRLRCAELLNEHSGPKRKRKLLVVAPKADPKPPLPPRVPG
jgi:hypothetical protein